MQVFDFIDQLDKFDDPNCLISAFQTLIEGFGFSCFAVGDATSPRTGRIDRFWASTYPAAWQQHWSSRNFISIDPVIQRLFEQSTPFCWQDIRKQASGQGAAVMDEARAFQLNDGLSIGTHLLSGGVIGITMAAEKRVELSKHDQMLLHLASIYFEERLQRLKKLSAAFESQALSARERDCMSWVANGKTDWEISRILGISEATAKEYMHNAMRKLNAANRAHAVAIAIARRAIVP